MITATFLALSGVALPQPQADIAGSLDAFSADAALVVEIDETSLSAQSFSELEMLLVFAGDDPDLSTTFWLHAGTRYEEEFSRGTLAGLRIDVLLREEGGWRTTGALVLQDDSTSSNRLRVLSCGHALADDGEGNELRMVTPAGSLLPPQFQEIAEGPPAHHFHLAPSPRHVPVQTPTDKPRGYKPPKLEKKPLPPV